MERKNLIVGQSGGPTAVINSSLYGVVAQAREEASSIGRIYGMVNGIQGFLEGKFLDFEEALPGEELKLLTTTPGAYLGSCRYKLPEDLNDDVYPKLFDKLEEMGIGYFFYIGGNDSMDTVSKLSRYAIQNRREIIVLGEPKTVDNDLVHTDHTPGFGSAAKFVATAVREITTDAEVYETKAVTIVEIMGRHAGWLTAASALARRFEGDNPLLVYLPEVPFQTEEFLHKIKELLETHNTIIACVSEGIRDASGTFICEYGAEAGVDNFGHKMLAGCGKYLENLVRAQLGVKVRSVELNVVQRCSSSRISATDQQEAIMAGRFGVQSALKGESCKMITFERKNSAPYELTCGLADVNEICNLEKTVPVDWIVDGCDIGQEFFDYALPLIQGDVSIPAGSDGLPRFAYRK